MFKRIDIMQKQTYVAVTAALLFSVSFLFVRGQETGRTLNEPPNGFQALFNGKNLEGWWGESTTNPRNYMSLRSEQLEKRKRKSLDRLQQHWRVVNGVLENDGNGPFLTTDQFFGDVELRLEYRIEPGTDSGVYLRGVPQVQIWDPTEHSEGSGGLWNNPDSWPGNTPAVRADRKPGNWNQLRIFMVGERVTVVLNGKRVVDHARLLNFFDKNTSRDRRTPVPRKGPIQLQTHGGETQWRNIFIRPIDPKEANRILRRGGVNKSRDESFEPIFNGRNFDGWMGALDSYRITDGNIQCKPGHRGHIYTKETYDDFAVQLDVRLPEAGNNGLAIRYPGNGNPAFDGMCELQVLDNTAEKFSDLDPRQYHGSVYGQWPADRGYLRETGEWNFQEVTVDGSHITVELNGTTILEKDISTIEEFMDKNSKYKGRRLKSGHFGFAGHNDPVSYRHIRIKELR